MSRRPIPNLPSSAASTASHNKNITERLGGYVRYWGFAHTFFQTMYTRTNILTPIPSISPWWTASVSAKRPQLCLTNPEVLEIVKTKLRQKIIEHPECKIFCMAQMDWYNPCQCPECARVDAEEGAHSGSQLRFIKRPRRFHRRGVPRCDTRARRLSIHPPGAQDHQAPTQRLCPA